MDRRRGRYLGTEIDGKWWKRYMKDGLMMRGNGVHWYDRSTFWFLRYLSQDPIAIPFEKMTGVRVGTWHAGRWALGLPIIKFVWENQGQSLTSGFVLAYESQEALRILEELKQCIDSYVVESPTASSSSL
jgi:hypothetical protein